MGVMQGCALKKELHVLFNKLSEFTAGATRDLHGASTLEAFELLGVVREARGEWGDVLAVDLSKITEDNYLRADTDACCDCFDLVRGEALRLVENHERVNK